MTDRQAKKGLNDLVWDGTSIADQLKLGAEWNAEAHRRRWPTSPHYWKRHSYKPIGRWKYSIDDDQDEPHDS